MSYVSGDFFDLSGKGLVPLLICCDSIWQCYEQAVNVYCKYPLDCSYLYFYMHFRNSFNLDKTEQI